MRMLERLVGKENLLDVFLKISVGEVSVIDRTFFTALAPTPRVLHSHLAAVRVQHSQHAAECVWQST
jgi:hypothetical protein